MSSIARELKRSAYNVTMSILGSRDFMCINEEVLTKNVSTLRHRCMVATRMAPAKSLVEENGEESGVRNSDENLSGDENQGADGREKQKNTTRKFGLISGKPRLG